MISSLRSETAGAGLAKDEILKSLRKKEIIISPYNKNNVGPASYDLTLAGEFRKYDRSHRITASDAIDYKKLTKKIRANSYQLRPGELILGISNETIRL